MLTRQQLQNDLDASISRNERCQIEIDRLNVRVRELVSENERLARETDHHRLVWNVLDNLSAR